MSEVRNFTLVLTGPYRGKTRLLNGYQFVKGVLNFRGTMEQVQGLVTYFGRTYRAYLEGSTELREAEEHYEAELARRRAISEEAAANGQHDPEGSQPNPPSPADETRVQPDGTGPSPSSADDGLGDDDPEAGASGSVPGGDGHQDTGIPPEDQKRPEGNQQRQVANKLLKAVMELDPDNDEHWTAAGLPKLAAVGEALGEDSVTRKQVVAVAGDHDRDKARALADAAKLDELA